MAREIKPKQLAAGPARVLRTLDAFGVHTLIRDTNPDGSTQAAVFDLQTNERCELPKDTLHAWNPLSPNAATARTVPTRNFLMPFARGQDDASLALWLLDQDCTETGPLAAIRHDTAFTFASVEDQRDIFGFRDRDGTLYVLDAQQGLVANAVARNVAAAVSSSDMTRGDVLWVIEGGKLTQRQLDGSLAIELGNDVTEFALYGGQSARVAYVDGGNLYEAAAPTYRPALRAEDACNVSYNGQALDLHHPCSSLQLVRVDLLTGAIKEFEPGVYSSQDQAGLQFDYANVPKADGSDGKEEAMFVELPSNKANGQRVRQRIVPVLQSGLTVLSSDPDTGRVAGQTKDFTFGVWQLGTRTFTAVLENARALIPLRDTRASRYLWLTHHDAVDELGTLSVFTETDLTLKDVARGVPPYGNRGYIIDVGGALPRFPYPEAILIYLEDSVELAVSTAKNRLFRGRLRAQLLSGALASDIDDDVSSFVLVATPLPGVLYGIEEGPRAGLWFAAL